MSKVFVVFGESRRALLRSVLPARVGVPVCLGLIALVSALEAWPVSRLFWASHAGLPLSTFERALVAACFAGALLACTVAFAWSHRSGVRALARLQV